MLDRSFIRQSAAAAGFDLCGVAPCRHLVRNEQFFRRWARRRASRLARLPRTESRQAVRRATAGRRGADGSRLRRRLQERPERRLSRRLPREDRLVCPDRRLPCHDQGDAGRPLRASSCRGACPRRPGVRRFGSARGKAAGRRSGAGLDRPGSRCSSRPGSDRSSCWASWCSTRPAIVTTSRSPARGAAPAAAASKPARQVPFATTARSMRAAASPVIRSNGRRLRKLPSTGGFSAATPARAAAPTTSVRRCIFIRRSIRCSIPCRSRPNGGSRWRRRNSARRSAARRSCAAASGASKPMRRKTCAERDDRDYLCGMSK